MSDLFVDRIADRTARIAVIGQGYVGLPLALVFCEAGFDVTGFDLDATKVAALGRGESYIRHIGPERVATAVHSGRYRATADFDALGNCPLPSQFVPAVFIVGSTPLEHPYIGSWNQLVSALHD